MQSLFLSRRFGVFLLAMLVAALLLLMWQGGVFRSAQLALSNFYFVPDTPSDAIVIVALDDASLQAYGRSPSDWSRQNYADLVQILSAAEARVIAFDLLFSEETPEDAAFVESIIAARQSESRTRVVFASAGVGLPLSPYDSAAYPQAIRFENALLPVANLAEVSDYFGFVNAYIDVDTRIRRQSSMVYLNEEAYLSFPLATYLAYLRIPSVAFSQVVTAAANQIAVTSERQLQVDENGLWLQNFFGAPSRGENSTFRTVSLLDVLAGRIDPNIFNDKLVLVGLMTVAGDADRYPVPSDIAGELMAGVEIQANAIESLMSDKLPRELGSTWQALSILALSLLSSWLYAYPRWYWKLALALLLVLLAFIVAFVIYNFEFLIIPLFYPILALILPALGHIGLDTSREIGLRRQSDFLLRTLGELTEQRLNLNSILPYIAKDIQSLLPASLGAIFLRQKPDVPLKRAYHWTVDSPMQNYEALVLDVERTGIKQAIGKHLALPLYWQAHLGGVMLISHEQVQGREAVLEDFARRVAPIIENTLLYEELSRQRSTISSVLANTPSAVFVLDNQHKIGIYNEAAAHLLQAQDQTLREKPLVDAFAALGIQAESQSLLLEKMKQHVAFQHELEIGEKSYSLAAALILSLQQWVFVLTDVTEFVELNKLKTRMLRMASHDLKNPLGRIMGYTQLLQSRPDMDEKSQRFLNNIINSTDEMTQLIGDLLDLERSRSGGLSKEAMDLREIVGQVLSRHEPDALQKQQTYHADIAEQDFTMQGDIRQLSQVVSNLIGNAIKYTPNEGKVTVRLSQDTQLARFEVQDTGYGISKAAQAELFTEFYRVRTSETAGIGGTGLGLSLVKGVVEAHGGRVGVESEEGKGSRFWVELPLETT